MTPRHAAPRHATPRHAPDTDGGLVKVIPPPVAVINVISHTTNTTVISTGLEEKDKRSSNKVCV